MLKKKRPNLENLAIFGKFASNSKKAPGFLVKNSKNAQNSPSISFFCLPFQIHVGKLQKLQKINFPLPIHPSCIEPWLLAAQNLFRHSYGTKNLTCAILRKYITSKRIAANTWFTFSDKMSGLTHETWNWTQKCVHWVIMILSYGLSNTEQKREKKRHRMTPGKRQCGYPSVDEWKRCQAHQLGHQRESKGGAPPGITYQRKQNQLQQEDDKLSG